MFDYFLNVTTGIPEEPKVSIPYVALDLDPARVQAAVLAGETVCFGDASHYPLLENIKIKKAKALIITFYEATSAAKILQQVRLHNKKIPIIVRSHAESETDKLYTLGATEVIPETFEASIMLASHLLMLLKVPLTTVDQLIEESRQNRYDMLKRVFPGEETYRLDESSSPKMALHAVHLPQDAASIGKTIAALPLAELGVLIHYIRKKNQPHCKPEPNTQLEQEDVVILYGKLPQLEAAERILLEG